MALFPGIAMILTAQNTWAQELDDPLLVTAPAGVIRTVGGGQFQDGGGWKTTAGSDQVFYDLGAEVTEGEFVGEVRNFDPGTQSSSAKHHVFTMRAMPYQNDSLLDDTTPGFFWVRSGTNYPNGQLKFLSNEPGGGTIETRVLSNWPWDIGKSYRFRVTWNAAAITLFLDGQQIVSHPLTKAVPFRYLYLGRDGYHGYPAMVGPVTTRVTVKGVRVVPLWGVFDTGLTASGSYANQYLMMPGDNATPGFVVGTFTGPNGDVIAIDGFWDGGSSWRIRMAPTAVGKWSYATKSSDPGLNGKSGSFDCVPSTRKGFVRVNPSFPRSFMHADGTPFFLLGDTSWGRAWWGDHYLSGRFQKMVDGRAAHGFNVFSNAPLGYDQPALANEGGSIAADGVGNSDRINPAFFWWCDYRLAYMNEEGMLPLLMIGAPDGGLTTKAEQLIRFQRYLIARFSAYDVFYFFVKEFEEWKENGIPLVRELGKVCDKWDPYEHPTSTHTLDSTLEEVGDDLWLDFNTQQRQPFDRVASDAKNSSKPVVVSEYYYEWIPGPPGSNPFHVPMNAPVIRESLWKIQLSGGYNAGYQLVPDAANGLDDTYLSALDSDSARWHQYLRGFFEQKTEFWKLLPMNELVKSGDAFAAAEPGRQYVLYLSSGGDVAVDLSAASETLSVEWYDPRTGTTTAGEAVSGAEVRSFTAPDSNDWVLLLRGEAGDREAGDAGEVDAGEDAGATNQDDGKTVAEHETEVEGGCGCRATAAQPRLGALLLILLGVWIMAASRVN